MRRFIASILTALALALLMASNTPVGRVFSGPLLAAATSCENLMSLSLPQATITAAETVAAGAFTPPAPRGGAGAAGRGGRGGPNFGDLPAFCRVLATLKPSADSDIKMELWMPASGWNGKYQTAGNGGYAGALNPGALATALRRGYAAAATDTGHDGGAAFALGHPEKQIDFGYRALHETTVKAKAIVEAFYGNGPRYSYFNACSTGGRQALMEAQRFPNDFDGIVAGDPASYTSHMAAQQMWVAQAVHKDTASYIPPAKYPAIHKAVLDQCDALDGVKDGVLEDPTLCKFDPKVLECKNGDADTCLTAPQVEAARKLYTPPVNPRTKKEIFAALTPGSELAWNGLAGEQPFGYGNDFFRYFVFGDPNWDFKTLNFDSDIARAENSGGKIIDAMNPDIRPFFSRNGKLIQYHGWADQLIVPGVSITYYKSVVEKFGGVSKIDNSQRLFMVPGMLHCNGGDGPSTIDWLTAIENWVEKGQAPDRIIASRVENGNVVRTRPLCPYPQGASYKGSGSTDEAANFVCKAPSASQSARK